MASPTMIALSQWVLRSTHQQKVRRSGQPHLQLSRQPLAVMVPLVSIRRTDSLVMIVT
jgi:hypothetical protein